MDGSGEGEGGGGAGGGRLRLHVFLEQLCSVMRVTDRVRTRVRHQIVGRLRRIQLEWKTVLGSGRQKQWDEQATKAGGERENKRHGRACRSPSSVAARVGGDVLPLVAGCCWRFCESVNLYLYDKTRIFHFRDACHDRDILVYDFSGQNVF